MSRKKSSFSISKFLKWTLVVTLVIAAIEIPVIYYLAKPDAPAEPAGTVANTVATEPVSHQTIVAATAVRDTGTILPKVNKPEPVVTGSRAEEIAEKAQAVAAPTPAPVVKVEWSAAQKQQVLERLNAQRESLGANIRCVKIRQTNTSNVLQGFTIAEYLRDNGYFISGRETISGHVKGIKITAGGECFTLTIGSV